ncbi:hypothetical protein WICPIJ_005238 [Wickerhamomyces pijperi]|uniref:Uncharacterized protein n=1 Tax=Wickerhamomyces pijperi TaxID=599730 RepID=A0A9P8TMJ4_WICPI|nr:hypothetical protein WICPIJ_005238 [Wickerhamomyces pijperi]
MLRQFSKQIITRSIHTARPTLAAQLFKMPAMSPTMEAGGIENWKVKEGDSFSAGDVLLEIETDKATIDVEAQDDGKMFKIILQNGVKDIKVGEPIAVLADPNDDLATLAVPDLGSSAPAATPKTPAAPTPKAAASTPAPAPTPAQPAAEGIYQAAAVNQTFFPSVAALLDANHISREDALSKIKASGANGRILKGDVLAYLGLIPQSSLDKVSSFIHKNSKLDLSNIEKLKIQPKEDSAKNTETETAAAAPVKPKKNEPKTITKSFQLSHLLQFQEKSETHFSIDEYVQEASLRSERFAYGKHPVQSDAYDSIFEDLIALPTNVERFKVQLSIPALAEKSAIAAKPIDLVESLHREKDDLFDILTSSGTVSPKKSANNSSSGSSDEDVVVKITVNPKVADADAKAQLYLKQFERYLYDFNRTAIRTVTRVFSWSSWWSFDLLLELVLLRLVVVDKDVVLKVESLFDDYGFVVRSNTRSFGGYFPLRGV